MRSKTPKRSFTAASRTALDPPARGAEMAASARDTSQARPYIAGFSHPNPLLSRYLLAWFALVVCCVCWQPFELGFYLDDWSVIKLAVTHGAAFSKDRLQYLFGVDPSRWGAVPLRFVASSLFGESSLLWQGAGLISQFLLAYAIYGLVRSLAPALAPRQRTAAVAVASAWLLLPWCVGFRFWPILFPTYWLLIAFVALTAFLSREWQSGNGPILLPALVYFWICCSYEAFYFQFASVIAVGLCLVAAGRASVRPVLRSSAALAVAQACAAAGYLFAVHRSGATRPITQNWVHMLSLNIRVAAPVAVQSMREISVLFVTCVSAAILIAAWVLFRGFRSQAQRPRARFVLTVCGACAVGALIAVTAYSLGGRGLGFGPDSRAFAIPSVWALVAVGVIAAFAAESLHGIPWKILVIVGFAVGACLGIGNLLRGQDWAQAWNQQRRVLSEAPIGQIAAVEPSSLILYVNRFDINGAPIFSASWDLNWAMPLTYDAAKGKTFIVYNSWAGPVSWNGHALSYPDQYQIPTPGKLYVWEASKLRFWEARTPFVVNQDLSITQTAPQ